MICGQQTFIPDIQQHRFCTLPLEPGENQNHDMPNQENKIRPHRSGEWTWASQYPEIGPEMDSGEFYFVDHDEITPRTCDRCGAECDLRVGVCHCTDECTYPKVDR